MRASYIKCAECGEQFVPTRDWQRFCCPSHKRSFERIQERRGAVVAPFVAVHQRSRGTETRELRAYARRQITGLEAIWREEDRAAGRSPDVIVLAKKDAAWSPVDLQEKPAEAPPACGAAVLPADLAVGMHPGLILSSDEAGLA